VHAFYFTTPPQDIYWKARRQSAIKKGSKRIEAVYLRAEIQFR